MFIREKIKGNKKYRKTYTYHLLVQSVRTPQGPRQKTLLNLGTLSIEKERWPLLARGIQDVVQGQTYLDYLEYDIKYLVERYAHELLQKCERDSASCDLPPFETIEIGSLAPQRPRTIGTEYTSLSYLKKLQLDRLLKQLNFTPRQIEIATLLIIGRLTSPGSERHTHSWGQHVSGLDELLDTDFTHLSLNSLYHVSDKLVRHQHSIESHLRKKERSLFGLDEKIILYDLTNTYFEGEASGNKKAKFGRSKEKRSDCRLVTLGLVLDGQGFPKTSQVFAGNQSEPKTLKKMLDTLSAKSDSYSFGADTPSSGVRSKRTVVLDAGIATEANLAELKDSYHYLCVSRRKIELDESAEKYMTLKKSKHQRIDVQLHKTDDEVYLLCNSCGKSKKEKGIRSRLEQLFEEQLTSIGAAIHKKGGTKKYPKVLERIGRAKEKYKRIARYYTVTVEEENGLTTRVKWEYSKEPDADKNFSGTYVIRTDRTDLTEHEIWKIYTMLLDLEDAFRIMKSELGIRPNFHQKEHRSDGHLFISVLAYHILHSIRTNLKDRGIRYRWETLRKRLCTHQRVTTRWKNKKGKTIYVRQCTEPEPFHKLLYDALEIPHEPVKSKKFIF